MGHEPHYLSDFKWLKHVYTLTNRNEKEKEREL